VTAADALLTARGPARRGRHGPADLRRRRDPSGPAGRQVDRRGSAVRMVVRIRAHGRFLSRPGSKRHEVGERPQSSPNAAGAGAV